MGTGTSRILWGAGWAVVGLVLLPLVGMVLSASQPPGLVEPPPITFDRLWPLVVRTMVLAASVSVLTLSLGTWLAWVEVRASYPGGRVLGILAILPLAVPSYLLATIVREMMAPAGAVGGLLGTQGAFTGLIPSILVLTVACTPYVQILVGAALRRLPVSEDEAARSLGAGAWRRFISLAAPRLRPTWAFSLVLVALYVVSDFGAVAVLNCEVLTWELYKARGARDAYVLALGMLVCVLPLLGAVRWLHGAAEVERHQGKTRSYTPGPLGLLPCCFSYVSHAVVVGIGVVVPLVALVSWVRSGLHHGVEFAPIMDSLWTTVGYASVGGLVVLIASIPAAAVTAGGRGRFAGLMEHGVYLTSSIPGVLLAFGVLHLVLSLKRVAPWSVGDVSTWTWLEGGGVFLLMGYVMRFLSQGYAAVKPAILRVDKRLLEAARSLGAGSWRRLRHVWAPSMAPGLAAAYVLLFLAVAKELPVTLMLIPAGQQTLAYGIFDAQSEGSMPDVGVAGLLLLCLAMVVQMAVQRWRRHV
ncbi:MAG: iron ABC transporter permease [Myxococcota bacterium]|nr:iron ABC transporter permease [Myxococcota bacterium]